MSERQEVNMKKVDFSIAGLLKDPYVASERGPSFSVVHIQNAAFLRSRFQDSEDVEEDHRTAEELKTSGDFEEEEAKQNFSWLFCSRFKPPKLPRSKKRSNCKRYGRGPRIPFAAHQISVLESAFRKSHYLSPDNINRLAETLYLSETRVKIWFQNRRARYRREQEMVALNSLAQGSTSSSPTIVSSDPLEFIPTASPTSATFKLTSAFAERFIAAVPTTAATSVLHHQQLQLRLSPTGTTSAGRRLFVFGSSGGSSSGAAAAARSLSSPETLMDFSTSSSSSSFVNVLK